MTNNEGWLSNLLNTVDVSLRRAGEFAPSFLAAVGILILGWILARVARRIMQNLASSANQTLGRRLAAGPMAAVRISPLMAKLLAGALFWVVLAIAAALSLRVAGFGMITTWLDRISVHAPNLLAAVSILVAGVLLGVFIREKIAPTTVNITTPRPNALIARATQIGVVTLASIVALDQLGLDVGLLIAVTVVIFAGAVVTFGATLALGARHHAANLVGIHSAQAQIAPGQWLQIDDVVGQVVEVCPARIVLDTQTGRTLLPGHLLSDRVAKIFDHDPHADAESE